MGFIHEHPTLHAAWRHLAEAGRELADLPRSVDIGECQDVPMFYSNQDIYEENHTFYQGKWISLFLYSVTFDLGFNDPELVVVVIVVVVFVVVAAVKMSNGVQLLRFARLNVDSSWNKIYDL